MAGLAHACFVLSHTVSTCAAFIPENSNEDYDHKRSLVWPNVAAVALYTHVYTVRDMQTCCISSFP